MSPERLLVRVAGACFCLCPLSALPRLASSSPKPGKTPHSLAYFNVLSLQLCSLRDFYFSGRKHGKWQQPDLLVIAELWVKYFEFHCGSYNGCEILKTNFKCIIVAQYFPVCKRFSLGVWLFGGLCAAWVMNRPLGLIFIPACYPSLGCLQILTSVMRGLMWCLNVWWAPFICFYTLVNSCWTSPECFILSFLWLEVTSKPAVLCTPVCLHVQTPTPNRIRSCCCS